MPHPLWFILALLYSLALQGCGASQSTVQATSAQQTPPQAPVTAAPAAPDPTIKWALAGTLADGGTIQGTFSYNPTEGPLQQNVRGFAPNQVYALSDWSISVTTRLGSTTFSKSDNYEVCLGSCIFGMSSPSEKLSWTNGSQILQLVMTLPVIMTLHLPTVVSEWGQLDGSASNIQSTVNGQFQYLILVRTLSITPIIQ